MRPGSTAVALPLAASLSLLALTGCARAVVVPPAPSGAAVGCADVARELPQRVGGLAARTTTAQGAAAWGPAGAPEGGSGQVVLRCGVDPPGPTTAECSAVTGPDQPEVDWISVQGPRGSRFTTYGRSPATQVVVPSTLTDADPALTQAVLADVAAAVATVPAQRRCVGPDGRQG